MRNFLNLVSGLGLAIALAFAFLPINSLGQTETTEPPTAPQPQPQPTEPIEPQPTPPIEEELEPVEFVDPREIKEVLRQLKDLKRETRRVLKRAQKTAAFANEVNQLNVLLSEIDKFTSTINNLPPEMTQREVLQDFYDAQLWEILNDIRAKIELPQELKNIERDLKRLEKLTASKRFAIEKVDLTVVQTKIAEIKSAISEARDYFNQGNFEDAREALGIIHEGTHPGEILGVLHQLREINQWLKRIKKEVRDELYELLEPVYEAVNEGDFREANMMLGEIREELWRLFAKIKTKPIINEEIRQKIEKLEEKLEGKQQQIEEGKTVPGPQSKSYQPYKPYTASVFNTIWDWLKGIFGF